MLSPGRGIEGLDRLDVRLVALLGLALLPIGLIAMVQTYRVINGAYANAEAALIGTTQQSVSRQRESVLRLRGAAQLAAVVIPDLLQDPAICSAEMDAYASLYPGVSFIGYIDGDGIVRCASDGVGTDVSGTEVFQEAIQSQDPTVDAIVGAVSGRSVIVVTQPVTIDGEAAGYIGVSIPQTPIDLTVNPQIQEQPVLTVAYSNTGQILWSQLGGDEVDELPSDRPLSNMATEGPASFIAPNGEGVDRVYAIAPMVPGEIYALTAWPVRVVHPGGFTAVSAILFPLLMWLVSIAVAYFAVHRMVVRHIRYLRLRIRAFTANRRILAPSYPGDTPSEIREVIEAFHQMTQRIVRDEADLENSLHEKDVLLKEVHHRVKNNLQLIASMTNMQLRSATSDETRFVLRRLQDRVLGLATIHRNLYQANVLSRVNAGNLVRDLADQSLSTVDEEHRDAVDVDIEVEHVALYPDQAVPLALLVTETMTNALRYVGQPEAGRASVTLKLWRLDDGRVKLTVQNSVGKPIGPERGAPSTGLGTQLVQAFVLQLDANSDVDIGERTYTVHIDFSPTDFSVAS